MNLDFVNDDQSGFIPTPLSFKRNGLTGEFDEGNDRNDRKII